MRDDMSALRSASSPIRSRPEGRLRIGCFWSACIGRGKDFLRPKGQPGQSTVELALIVSLLAVVALGLLDFGRAFYANIALTNVAREGARFATRNAPACDDAAIVTFTAGLAVAEQLDPSITITTNCVGSSCIDPAAGEVAGLPGDRRRVCIEYPFTPVTPLVAQWGNGTTITLRTWATLPT
jgi:hypothetical protein